MQRKRSRQEEESTATAKPDVDIAYDYVRYVSFSCNCLAYLELHYYNHRQKELEKLGCILIVRFLDVEQLTQRKKKI